MSNKNKIPVYVKKLIKQYPNIVSGRKNFKNHNSRIVKTIKIIKEYFKIRD